MVSKTWSAVIVHPRYFEPIRPKLRKGGVVLVDGDLLEEPLPEIPSQLISISATKLAREAEAPKAAALVLLGAFAQTTGIVSAQGLEEALAESLPSYRKESLESNRRALAIGQGSVAALSQPAWNSETA
jgi:Pyruvate/2-oxoacid:ferredoxin oxidoreductase gamma subunit